MLINRPESGHLDEIKRLISTKCSDEVAANKLHTAIFDAIDNYRQLAAPLVDKVGKYRDVADSTTNTRAELKKIRDLAVKLSEAVSSAAMGANGLLSRELQQSNGQIRHHVQSFAEASKRAYNGALALPNKPTDHHRVVMAMEIAKALLEAGITPSKAVPGGNITGGRGGALYGAILREACYEAGLSSVALKPLISAGIDLLNDPSLP